MIKQLISIAFFNASLANAQLMSTPVYDQERGLVGELMRSIESEAPYAAWVEIIFARKHEYSRHFTWLRNRLTSAKDDIEAPKVSVITGKELGDKQAKFREFYTGMPKRMKKVDDLLSKPLLLMAIQGMWISEDDKESRRRAHHLEEVLPFSHCRDEIDRLAVYEYYREPRLLIELVERRMVTDITRYFKSYTGARVEPPSFFVSSEELASYVHIPSLAQADKIHSINWGSSSSSPRISMKDESSYAKQKETDLSIVRTHSLPTWEEKETQASDRRLSLLASDTERSFEVLYQSGQMSIQLTSKTADDLLQYRNIFESVYGEIEFEQVTDPRPEFLKEVPLIAGLRRSQR